MKRTGTVPDRRIIYWPSAPSFTLSHLGARPPACLVVHVRLPAYQRVERGCYFVRAGFPGPVVVVRNGLIGRASGHLGRMFGLVVASCPREIDFFLAGAIRAFWNSAYLP